LNETKATILIISINNKNIQKHTKAHRKGVIGLDMALGTTWPQHNQQSSNDHPEKKKKNLT